MHMTQRNQIIQVMEKLGGVATLGQLNREVDCGGWKTKTPYASIRRIVQDKRYFFKIRPGLWALKTHRKKLRHLAGENQTPEKREQSDHAYYQGLLLEIGGIKGYETFAPDQDKNRVFYGATTLGEMRKLQSIYPFSYDDIVKRARMIDVIWFNKRRLPYAAFEVEHSTDFTEALSKYLMLQDFNTKFCVVAHQAKKRRFEEKMSRSEYQPIKGRVQFINYDKLADWHSKSMEAHAHRDMP